MEGKVQWQRVLRGMLLPFCAFFLILVFNVLEATHLIDQFYTTGISRGILTGISVITSRFPFSVAEPLALIIIAAFIFLMLRFIIAIICRSNVLARIISITDMISLLIIVFLVSWGFNYRQIGLAHISVDLAPAKEVSFAELEPLVRHLIHQAESERIAMGITDDMPFRYQGDMEEAAIEAYAELGKIYPEFRTPIGRPKPLISSRLFSHLGIAGIFIPFTAEANYNADQHELLRPASILHELAHLKGVAREGEANFMAYLASRYSKDPQVRYSATMLGLIQSANALENLDKQAAAESFQMYSPGMVIDLREYNLYWRQFQGEIQNRSRELNDAYLRSNGQEGGADTYQEMVNYLIRFHKPVNDVNQH